MLVMGVDENGLGPRLGPLVATSVVLETPKYRRAALCDRGLDLGLTDSKETGGFGHMAFIESVALARVASRAPGPLSERRDRSPMLGHRPSASGLRRRPHAWGGSAPQARRKVQAQGG
jgi:hypothetical protein